MLSIGSVVINVQDVRRAAAFWCAALGYEPLREIKDDWVILVPANGASGQRISINLSDQPAPDVPHIHLDLYAGDAEDQAAEVERLIGLGAERVDWPSYPDGDHDYVVVADPDGNRFCVIDTVSG
jgi:catechol 2,3-dioxygenase-like lactoylglutathione lyase family enzyme